jgi:hypothetical protein
MLHGAVGFMLLASSLSAPDEASLEDLARRSFRYFEEHSNRETGITRDRARSTGEPRGEAGSIAATGFALSGYCIAAERGWIPREKAVRRTRVTLEFFATGAPHVRGWFYHWMDARTGERIWASEISSIDTALFLAGALTARQCFRDDPEIVRLATLLYERVDFHWMRNGHPHLLSHGWRPETGFLPYNWDTYSEHPILYVLGIGSPTHAIPSEAWYAWHRDDNSYADLRFIGRAPLFTHQYSHAWIDFRGRRESRGSRLDYFENTIAATRAHRQFCIDLSREFPGYSEDVWGITASDSENGYADWGGPPRRAQLDGTVTPSAAGGALMFTPNIALPAVRTMRERYGERIYGRYGFAGAFNPITGWVAPDVIGIDAGITLLSIENLRSARVWRWFMANPEIPRALDDIGLVLTANHR